MVTDSSSFETIETFEHACLYNVYIESTVFAVK